MRVAATEFGARRSADEVVETAFVEYLEGEAARVEGAEAPEVALVEFLRALRMRAIQTVERGVFGPGAEALRRALAAEDAAAMTRIFSGELAGPDAAGLLAALAETRADLATRGDDDADPDVVAALDRLHEIAAETKEPP